MLSLMCIYNPNAVLQEFHYLPCHTREIDIMVEHINIYI